MPSWLRGPPRFRRRGLSESCVPDGTICQAELWLEGILRGATVIPVFNATELFKHQARAAHAGQSQVQYTVRALAMALSLITWAKELRVLTDEFVLS